MTTSYFDRNVFDQIDKGRDVTPADIELIRAEVAAGRLSILVSFETVAETIMANQDTALRGLQLIKTLTRQVLPIKRHMDLLRDDIRAFAEGREPVPPFVGARFSVDRMIEDVKTSPQSLREDIAAEKRHKGKLNDDLSAYIDDERKALGGRRPASFEKYWAERSGYYAEAFAYFAGYLEECRGRGIDELLKVRSVRMVVGALLSLLYSLLVEGQSVQRGTSYDMKHAATMSAADIVVSDDRELRRLLGRAPVPGLRVVSLPDFVGLIRSGGLRS
jgi:hypothetical protein